MLKIAITGGIGSGKTAVTDYLTKLGFDIIDADIISRQLTAKNGKALPFIRNNFGNDAFFEDGSLNKEYIRELIFNDIEKKKILEYGTTNLIIKQIEDELVNNENNGKKVVFVAAPLLFEFNMQENYDSVWLIVSNLKNRVKRICNRDNISEEMALKIIASQLDDEIKIKLSDEIISNNEDLDNLYSKIDALLKKYSLI